jgi:ABC-2 type transport system permease protein
MSVFSVCLRIFKKNLPLLAIYFAVFVMVSTIVTIMSAPSEPGEYGNTRVRMAFFSQEDTPLAEGLKGALARQAYFVDTPDEREKLQEALFYRRVHYILRIPEGFTNAFLQGRPAALERTSIPGSASATCRRAALMRSTLPMTAA